jgi:tetratricopeptide (TPR) repeat protein
MNEQGISTIRKEVAHFMYLVATRNRAEIENKAEDFILSLESRTEPESQGLLLFVKGITDFFHNNYAEAKAHFIKVFELDSSYTDLWGMAHMGLGFTHRSTGHLDEAVSNLSSATELIDENGEFKIFVAYCFQSLGEIHTTINEYDISIDYFSKAYSANKEDLDRSGFFRFHLGLGGCYLKMKEYEKSEYHLTQALEVDDRPPPIISRAENDIGVLYLEMKEFDKAEKYLLSSFNIRKANGLEDAACTSMTALAEVYLEQNKVSEAHNLLNDCMILVEKFQTKWKKIEVLKLLARAHSLSKNYELAINYYEQYIALYDEIKGEQERNILKFKNEQIEKQRQVISDKHNQLAATFEEIKRLKVNRKAVVFSWITIIILVLISEMILDPFIENYAYNNILSLLVKVLIALLFKPIDGLYEKVLWNRTLKKVS